jgi:hypothetical protein
MMPSQAWLHNAQHLSMALRLRPLLLRVRYPADPTQSSPPGCTAIESLTLVWTVRDDRELEWAAPILHRIATAAKGAAPGLPRIALRVHVTDKARLAPGAVGHLPRLPGASPCVVRRYLQRAAVAAVPFPIPRRSQPILRLPPTEAASRLVAPRPRA